MKTLVISLKIFLFLTILTGIIYPLIVTGIAQLVFPSKANGSLIVRDNIIIGSKLIGQKFDSTIYFSSRPSAISYNPLPSGGSNYGLTNIKLKNQVYQNRKQFIEFNHLDSSYQVPSEMLFASASGIDPHISPVAAFLQADRIADARNFNSGQRKKLMECIIKNTENPQFSFLGEKRINVLVLNLEIDQISLNKTEKKI